MDEILAICVACALFALIGGAVGYNAGRDVMAEKYCKMHEYTTGREYNGKVICSTEQVLNERIKNTEGGAN